MPAAWVHIEEWRRNGERHRKDGPALIERQADGSSRTAYFQHDQLHREGGPADVEVLPRGAVLTTWAVEGRLIKVEKSSPDGDLQVTFYDSEKRLHRDDGPALIEREGGELIEEWYEHGELMKTQRTDADGEVTDVPIDSN